MTFDFKIWLAVSRSDTGSGEQFMPDDMRPDIMEAIFKGMSEMSGEQNPTWDTLQDEFDDHPLILFDVVAPFVLEAIERTKPMSWFKPVFMTKEAQRAMGLPV
jgi:hypothetical protein